MPNTFKRNVVIAFGFSLLLLLLSSIASYISIRNLIDSAEWVDHTNTVISEHEQINITLQESESSQRGYLLTGDSSFLAAFEKGSRDVPEKIAKLRKTTSDNTQQQSNISRLEYLVNQRFSILNIGVRARNEGKLINNNVLIRGKEYMDETSALIRKMEQQERALYSQRSARFQFLITYTPLIIIFAALLSIIITVFFYGRIIADYRRRTQLQEELERKDILLSQRLAILRDLASKISAGDYKVRIDDEGKDILGSLSGTLNKMAESLEYSFGLLSDKEWLQAGVAGINKSMIGEMDIRHLSENILGFIVNYSNSNIGAMYLLKNNEELELISSYAADSNLKKVIRMNEGIAGQAAVDRKMIVLDNLEQGQFNITYSSGSLTPENIVAIPIMHEETLKGVVELGKLTKYSQNEIQFFSTISSLTGVSINTTQNRRRMQELLEETQSQSEELQMQHSELENINEALKAKSQRLQVSEEELRVQQEELMQTNTELEERTTMLEEKNQMIEERNIEIQQKARELEISARYKSEFLANMSHELRTPLNSILLLARLMADNKRENLDEEQIEYAKVIEKSGQGLLSLIDEILDLSRIEAGKMTMEFQQVALKEITNDLTALFNPVANQKNIQFNVDISKDVPEQIETDKMRLEQVLKNLISNAIKFTSKGHVSLVVVKSSANKNEIIFTIKDTGIGIPAEKQGLIFDAFQQADGSTRRQYGGTGLGLSISKELARLLGGTISLQSEPGKGSEFSLVVPVRKPTGSKEPSYSEPGAISQKKEDHHDDKGVLITEDDTSAKMTQVLQRIEKVLTKEPKKVLILEENKIHARALFYFLENFNIVSEIKSNTDESINALLQKDMNCIIFDMSAENGKLYESLEKIKTTPGLELLPIIIFTQKSLSKLEEGRMRQYANSIIIKTAHSYQRILDEVSLFLHLSQGKANTQKYHDLGRLTEVLKDKKVMIADDDVRNIFSLSKVLESAGMHVVSATDGKEALDHLKKNPSVDIVLMDMMMPEMDGYEAMRTIRSMPGMSKIPIIAVTAKAMADDRQKCISAGASDYITKPIDKDQLMSLLRVWLYDRN
jgi:signal transduction histidine kinase/CHASE3 domain sensor protein/DNA-binding response OmpR family regulator